MLWSCCLLIGLAVESLLSPYTSQVKMECLAHCSTLMKPSIRAILATGAAFTAEFVEMTVDGIVGFLSRTLTRNIRQRRGAKVAINIPSKCHVADRLLVCCVLKFAVELRVKKCQSGYMAR